MKQIIQNLRNGETILEEIPSPEVKRGHVLIKTRCSLVSLGTEKMLVEFGRSNLISKARQQPDKVKQVLDKIKTDGLIPTLEAVFNKLDEPLPLGYCNAGEIIEVGEGVTEFKPGDRVISNGPHAEVVLVPKNLVAKIPDNVSFEEAAFTVIGSIGLQGIRLANPTFGETVVVVGLGLIGLITAELLIANGCEVIGFDIDENKINIAKSKGIKAYSSADSDSVLTVIGATDGIGADAVIITASAKTDELISQAARMSRKRGRIILVGVIGLDLKRSEFYEKELSFQVSCSYGPGRYDEDYENKGKDYPLAFVRWTENRNFRSILNAISKGTLKVKELITERVELKDFGLIYNDMSKRNSVASIINYPSSSDIATVIKISGSKEIQPGKGVLAIIGAGNFTKMTMLPALKKSNAAVSSIVSSKGLSGTALAKKFNIPKSSTNFKDAINDSAVDAVLITTRHNLHASMTIQSLNAGKNVFVEKPLVLTEQELTEVVETVDKTRKSVIVGFNRRFSPFIQKAKNLLKGSTEPMHITINVNSGFIPANHWVHDPLVGGGRIIGEGCHFIDLAAYLSGSLISEVSATYLGNDFQENTDNVSMMLKMENGSTAVVNYLSNGNKSFPKEMIQIFSQQRILTIDNFRKMKGYGFKGFSSMTGNQDKGHFDQFNSYIQSLKLGGKPIIPFEEIINSTRATFAVMKALKTKSWENV